MSRRVGIFVLRTNLVFPLLVFKLLSRCDRSVNYLPTETDRIIVIQDAGLQGAQLRARGREQKFRTETITLLELSLNREKERWI